MLLLNGNRLNEIEHGAFDGLRSLKVLEFWGNDLSRLPVGMTLALEKLVSHGVSFFGNPLTCQPTLRATQGSDLFLSQLNDLPECLLICCDSHLKFLIGGNDNTNKASDLHARSVTTALGFLRSDTANALDATLLDAKVDRDRIQGWGPVLVYWRPGVFSTARPFGYPGRGLQGVFWDDSGVVLSLPRRLRNVFPGERGPNRHGAAVWL